MLLIATQCFPPRGGGIENLISGLAAALTERGRTVEVYADSHGANDEREFDASVPYGVVRRGGFKPVRRVRKAALIRQRLSAGGVRGIFSDSWKSAEWIAHRANGLRIPLVCLAHGNEVLDHGHAARRRRVFRIFSKVHRVAANSTDTAQRILALGVAPSRVQVVHPGVSLLADGDYELLSDIKLGSPVLITLARLEPRKGQDQVIAILPRLLEEYPRLSYVIAGDGAYREQLEIMSEQGNLTEHVVFTGHVSEARKAALLARADLFVMPSRYDHRTQSVEGFGIAYIEAALAGVPAVAGRAGGAGDAVQDGETGVLCDGASPDSVADAILRCLRDDVLRNSMGIAAARRAQTELLWPRALDAYLACLE